MVACDFSNDILERPYSPVRITAGSDVAVRCGLVAVPRTRLGEVEWECRHRHERQMMVEAVTISEACQ